MDFINWVFGRDTFDIKRLGQVEKIIEFKIVDGYVYVPNNIISDEEENGRIFLKKLGKEIQKEELIKNK